MLSNWNTKNIFKTFMYVVHEMKQTTEVRTTDDVFLMD